MRMPLLLAGLASLVIAQPVLADEDSITLKGDQGRDVVEQNCAACHSLDYIMINSPFLDRTKWEATVKKMIGVYGAPISMDDTSVIIDFLTRRYGKP